MSRDGYLFGGLLDEVVLMCLEGDDEPEEVVDVGEVDGVSDAFGLDHQQALKGVDYFLNLLPLVWTFFDLRQIRLDNLVNQLVLLDENKQQVMRRFPHLGLR